MQLLPMLCVRYFVYTNCCKMNLLVVAAVFPLISGRGSLSNLSLHHGRAST